MLSLKAHMAHKQSSKVANNIYERTKNVLSKYSSQIERLKDENERLIEENYLLKRRLKDN